jgi:hypothetical protein
MYRRYVRPRTIAIASACAAALALAPPASAAQSFGSDLTSNPTVGASTTGQPFVFLSYLARTGQVLPLTAPASGVMVKLRFRQAAQGASTRTLATRILTKVGNTPDFAARTGPNIVLQPNTAAGNIAETVPIDGVGDPKGVPIAAGEYLAMLGPHLYAGVLASVSGASHAYAEGDQTSGTRSYGTAASNFEVPLQGVIEPDADGDSYGDESQDSCPGNPVVHKGACPGNDNDADGVPNDTDNCVNLANPDQTNTDGSADGGDACDTDDDNDGVADTSDNCTTVANPDQTNTDGAGDGGDACDTDDDNDGLLDAQDPLPLDPTNGGVEGRPTAGDDILNGTLNADRICGLGGNDQITGLQGDDVLFGDQCDANSLMAQVFAAAADDGNDRIKGNEGNDTLTGSGGNDNLDGGAGNDTILGGSGNDKLTGGAGKDSLKAGPGNDKLTGGKGKNRYSAGAGNDTVNARNRKKETIDCGKGKKDRATVDKSDKVKNCETVRRK